MEQYSAVNEDWKGNYSFDQAVILEDEEDESYIFMSRPYSSLYQLEKGLANLVTCAHMDHVLDGEEFDERDLNYEQLYR